MSRIGRMPINVPAGVDVKVGEDNTISVKGPLGELSYTAASIISVKLDGAVINVTRPNDAPETRALHGLTRTLINNMVVGVKDGYSKTLQIVGVGYSAAKSGTTLTLRLGHSHPIVFEEGDGIKFEVPDANTVIVKGYDKQKVGAVSANIRGKRPPEPYHGKGVKYAGERIRLKAGKTGK